MQLFLLFKKPADKYGSLSDDELLNRFRSPGDMPVIEELFNRYAHLLYGVCIKYLKDTEEAKDAVMEIFGILIEKIPVTSINYFKGWVYTVTKNHCLMKLRKDGSERKHHDELVQNLNEEFMESDTFMNLYNEDTTVFQAENLNTMLNKLNREQEKCLRMMYLENRSYKEITRITGYSLNQVKSYIQNGKRNLKILIMNNNGKQE